MDTPRPWTRSLFCWLLGGLFFLTIAMADLASGNFKVTKTENLRHAEKVFGGIADESERGLALRYVASELNRFFFERYNVAHLVLTIALLALYVLDGRRDRLVSGLLLFFFGLSLVFLFYFTPTLRDWGRQIDFVPRNPKPPEVVAFYRLHTVNVVLEMLKLVGILVILFRVARIHSRPHV